MSTLPMFPLGSVLFPFAFLTLHVFEERYRRMTKDCLAGAREFGVVLIDRGHEVGGGDHRTDLGTVASIAEVEESEDGRFALACFGVRRIRVVRWRGEDPYPQAEVETLPDGSWSPAADEALAAADRVVRRSMALRAELAEPTAPIGIEVSPEAEVAAWQLASLSPLGPLDRQRLLAIDDPAERLRELTTMTAEECTVLAQRLAGF